MSFHVGFTGTQEGMTTEQADAVQRRLREIARHNEQPLVFHHGDCIGADAQAASFADELDFKIEAHPTDIPGKRAHARADYVHPVKAPLDRNRDIVDASHLLIATPRGDVEELRSGTWMTIRYGRKNCPSVWVVLPGGGVIA